MNMNHVAQLVDGGITTHKGTDLLDDVGTMGTIGMTAEDAAVGGIGEEFQHSIGLVHGESLAIGTPESFVAGVTRR